MFHWKILEGIFLLFKVCLDNNQTDLKNVTVTVCENINTAFKTFEKRFIAVILYLIPFALPMHPSSIPWNHSLSDRFQGVEEGCIENEWVILVTEQGTKMKEFVTISQAITVLFIFMVLFSELEASTDDRRCFYLVKKFFLRKKFW